MRQSPVGMIGLGLMGTALTERLLEAGFSVTVYNRTQAKAEPLLARGAEWSDNPLARCDRVIVSLYTTDVVEQVLGRLEAGLRPGQILIDTTTGDPQQTAALGARLAERGVQYLEAPISGSSQQTRRGEVTVIVGGPREAYQACRDLFDSVAEKVRTVGDFFMPRRFGKAMMITHAFGTGTASDQAVVVASETFQSGLSGIWWQWVWLPATPFYWLIAPIMRRFRAVTTADVYTLRYDRSVAVLFAVVGMAGLSVKIGLMLKGSGALVDSATGGLVDANWAIAIITVLFVLYGSVGGLGAAIVTDFVQGLLTIVFSFMLLPFVLQAVGGMEGIRQSVRDPSMFSLVVPGEIGTFFVVMYAVQALVGIVAQPFIMGVCAAGRTETDGRVGFMVGNLVKRLCTIAWTLTALGAVAWYLNHNVLFEIQSEGAYGLALSNVEPGKTYTVHGTPGKDGSGAKPEEIYVFTTQSDNLYASKVKPDFVYGDMARRFLSPVMPGLLGVFLAALLAAVMSSCDSFMLSSSGLFTKNIYQPLVPGKSNRHYVAVGRVVSLAVVAGGISFACWVPNVISALKIWFKIAPMMGIAFWMGLLWRRASVAGAWATTLAGFAAWFLATRPIAVELVQRLPFAESARLIWVDHGKPGIYEPWVIVFYTMTATLAGVVVSLLTKPVAREKLDHFYMLTRTPIAPGEEPTEPCTLPKGVAPPPRRMLFRAFDLEIPRPSCTSVVGFLAGWLAVAGLVGGFVWLVGR